MVALLLSGGCVGAVSPDRQAGGNDAAQRDAGQPDAGPDLDAQPGVFADAGLPAPADASEPDAGPAIDPWAARHEDRARAIADFLLAQQADSGAIPDYESGDTTNEDSNFEYALMGLGAAYAHFRDPRYLSGLEAGIRFLAAREELTDAPWRGSFRYVYAVHAPYAAIATSPGGGVVDVRGVDTTSALFVYLLDLHRRLSGSRALADAFDEHARAALDFVLAHDRLGDDPFTYSSWQTSGAEWQLYRYQYAADQGDVYLGLRAGAALFTDEAGTRYAAAADAIAAGLDAAFFLPEPARFAQGRMGPGAADAALDGFNAVFAQGYLPWAFGATPGTAGSYAWLAGKAQPDGSLVCFSGDPRYTLSAAILAMAARALGAPPPLATLDSLAASAVGGRVRDSADPNSPVLSNCAGFALLALLGARAL